MYVGLLAAAFLASAAPTSEELMCMPPPWLPAPEYLLNKRWAAQLIGQFAQATLKEKQDILAEGAFYDDPAVTGRWAERLERETAADWAVVTPPVVEPRNTYVLRKFFKERFNDLRLRTIGRAQALVDEIGRAQLDGRHHGDLATLRVRIVEARWQFRLAEAEFNTAEEVLEHTGMTCPGD